MFKNLLDKLFGKNQVNFLYSYVDPRVLSLINIPKVEIIFEVGSRFGDEAIDLSNTFINSHVYAFECNPETAELCKKNLDKNPNITFNNFALGSQESELTFYPYIVENNPGASSFFKRIDADTTQDMLGRVIKLRTGEAVMTELKLSKVDLLCMDVQGYELEVLKGFGYFLGKVRYIIMEEPSSTPDKNFLPEGTHSKYLNSPTPKEIYYFMKKNGFKEIGRFKENFIEDNVIYKNMNI